MSGGKNYSIYNTLFNDSNFSVPVIDTPANIYSMPYYIDRFINFTTDQGLDIKDQLYRKCFTLFKYTDTVIYNFLSYLIEIYEKSPENEQNKNLLNYLKCIIFTDNRCSTNINIETLFPEIYKYSGPDKEAFVVDIINNIIANILPVDIIRHFLFTSMLYAFTNDDKMIYFYLFKQTSGTDNACTYDIYRIEFKFTNVSKDSSTNDPGVNNYIEYYENQTMVCFKNCSMISNVNIIKMSNIKIESKYDDVKKIITQIDIIIPEEWHNAFKTISIIKGFSSKAYNTYTNSDKTSYTIEYKNFDNINKSNIGDKALYMLQFLIMAQPLIFNDLPIVADKKSLGRVVYEKIICAKRFYINSLNGADVESAVLFLKNIMLINNVSNLDNNNYYEAYSKCDFIKNDKKNWFFYSTLSNCFSYFDIIKEEDVKYKLNYIYFIKLFDLITSFMNDKIKGLSTAFTSNNIKQYYNILFTDTLYPLIKASYIMEQDSQDFYDIIDNYNLLQRLESINQLKYSDYNTLGKNANVIIKQSRTIDILENKCSELNKYFKDSNKYNRISLHGIDHLIFTIVDNNTIYKVLILPDENNNCNVLKLQKFEQQITSQFTENYIRFIVKQKTFGSIIINVSDNSNKNGSSSSLLVIISNINPNFVKSLYDKYTNNNAEVIKKIKNIILLMSNYNK